MWIDRNLETIKNVRKYGKQGQLLIRPLILKRDGYCFGKRERGRRKAEKLGGGRYIKYSISKAKGHLGARSTRRNTGLHGAQGCT